MVREVWKPVLGYDGIYSVSSEGIVRSEERRCQQRRWGKHSRRVPAKTLSQSTNRKGYRRVKLGDRTVCVHRLVLEAFVGPCPDGSQTRHLNGNASDNRPCNLAWGSSADNSADRDFHGTTSRGGAHRWTKLDAHKVRMIRRIACRTAELAGRFGVCKQTILDVRARKSWRWLV